jgi:hypothetical protein
MRTSFHSVRQPSAHRRPSCRLMVEPLESRTLMSRGLAALAFPLAIAPLAGGSHPPVDASLNGASAASQMPAFYDGKQITVNMNEQPENASASLIGHNQSTNTIYAYADLDEEQPFAPVIDAIQGEGFNPLWRQVLIQFNQGFTPHQFTSEEQVLAAAKAGEITLVTTNEVYLCAVVGGTGHKA